MMPRSLAALPFALPFALLVACTAGPDDRSPPGSHAPEQGEAPTAEIEAPAEGGAEADPEEVEADAPKAPGHTIVAGDFEAARQRAREESKLLLVNFSAYTCVNCRMVEYGWFHLDDFRSVLDSYVEARLHVDKGEPSSLDVQKLQDQLAGTRAVPAYLVLDPQRDNEVLGRFEFAAGGDPRERLLAFLEEPARRGDELLDEDGSP